MKVSITCVSPGCPLGFMNIMNIHGVADNLYWVSKALMAAEQRDFSCQINTTFSVRAVGTFTPSAA